MAQSPMQLPRHQILVPTRLPRPMTEAEGVAFFRVSDALEDRTMFLLMLRCGLRVSEVSRLLWAAIDMAQGTLRGNNGKGQVERVVSLSPDVATALRQWSGLRAAAVGYVFPSRMTRKGGLPLGARQIRNRMARSLQRAGLTKRYSPHSLRHYAAS
jgi:integrase